MDFNRESIQELRQSQLDNYLRQPAELISHFNREVSALEGYRERQLFELLQNADDSGVDGNDCSLLLHLSRERLLVANTGRPFSPKGFVSLVISDCSPKQLDRNRFIGCKGLGFRAVLTWTERPLVSSGEYTVVFDRARAIETVRDMVRKYPDVADVVNPFHEATGRWPAAIMRFPEVPSDDDPWVSETRAYHDRGYDTVLVLPLPEGARGDQIHNEMLQQISKLPTSALLFCKHLTQIHVEGDFQKSWSLSWEPIADRAKVCLTEDGRPENWEIYRHSGLVSPAVAEKSTGNRCDFEVAVAVPEKASPNREGSLCVFFPTRELLPCPLVMHATLEVTDDRNRLVNHKSNREVLSKLAAHVAAIVEQQVSAGQPRRGLELLRGIENADPELKALGFVDALVGECSRRSIFPRVDGTLKSASEVRQAPHETWLSHLSPDVFPETLAISPADSLAALVAVFGLSWFDAAILRARLRRYLETAEREKAGEVLGRLLVDGQLAGVSAQGLLIDSEGKLIDHGDCLFTPDKLPKLPEWASGIRFVSKDFQAGMLRGSKTNSLRLLAVYLAQYGGISFRYPHQGTDRAS
jgi:hypothetical protein